MKIFKKIGFALNVLKVYDEISLYLNVHHTSDKLKDAINTIKSGIDKLADIFPDVLFLKEEFISIFAKKGK